MSTEHIKCLEALSLEMPNKTRETPCITNLNYNRLTTFNFPHNRRAVPLPSFPFVSEREREQFVQKTCNKSETPSQKNRIFFQLLQDKICINLNG